MALYRLALVWLLRAIAVAVMAMALQSYLLMRRSVEAAGAVAEASGLLEPAFNYFVPAGAIALLCLTLSEILSLLSRRAQT